MSSSSRLSLLLASSLLLAACNSVSPNFYEPVNRVVTTGLPSLNGDSDAQSMRIFSFRIITPAKNVDLFSTLQATDPITPNQQNTLPASQLKVVQAAKAKIESHDYLNAEEATVLAFDAARQFAWDPEVARLAMNEILKIYAQRRDANLKSFRAAAEARAQYFIEKNKIAQQEYQQKARESVKTYFNGLPVTTAEMEEARKKQLEYQASFRKNYAFHMADAIARNKAAQDEYARQARAAHERILKQLDEETARARKREEEAQKLRKAQFEQILAEQKNLNFADFSVKDLAAGKPYALVSLTNGDFMLEGNQALPAVIQLSIDGFSQPIPVPVLPLTAHGRLLVSIDQDAQGNPVVLGGMDANTGARFDLNQVLFSIRTVNGVQQLEFLHPNGQSQKLPVSQLEGLICDTALDHIKPEQGQLDALTLQQRHAVFSQIQYQLTPELGRMDPALALEVLEGIKSSL